MCWRQIFSLSPCTSQRLAARTVKTFWSSSPAIAISSSASCCWPLLFSTLDVTSNSSRLYLPARTTPSYNHSPMRTSQFGTLYPPQCSRKHLAFALSNHSSQNRTSIYWRKTGSGLHKHTHNADLSFIFSLNSSLQCITLSLVFNMLTLYIYSLA